MIKIHNNNIILEDFDYENDKEKIEIFLKNGATFASEDYKLMYLSKKKQQEFISLDKRSYDKEFDKHLKKMKYLHEKNNSREYNFTFDKLYKIIDKLLYLGFIDIVNELLQKYEKFVWGFSENYGEAIILRKKICNKNKNISARPSIRNKRKKEKISNSELKEQYVSNKIESEKETQDIEKNEDVRLHDELISIYQNKNFSFESNNFKKNEMSVSKIPQIFEKDNSLERQEDTSDPIYLVIGLDIGTSTTKIVIHERFVDDQRFYPVHFGNLASKENPFLLPTRLSVSASRRLYIPFYNEPADYINLKLEFINQKSNFFIAYIALVIQYTQRWFSEKYGENDLYRGRSFEWEINLGAPLNKCEKVESDSLFYKALGKAYNLSKKTKIYIDDLNDAEVTNVAQNTHVTPEFSAEIQSYLSSEERKDGVHLMIDVGAGTLDCSTFFLHKNMCSIFSGEVPFLGGKIYELFLHKAVGTSEYVDTTSKVVDEEEFQKIYPAKSYEFKKRQNVFLKECRQYIGRCLQIARRKCPNDSNYWDTNTPIPTILCGGGKEIKIYKKILEEEGLYKKEIKQINHNISYHTDDINLLDQCRMFVAHGLSLYEDENCKLYWPDDLEPIEDNRSKTDHYALNPTGKAGEFD